jgi:hypothetical protein
MGTRWGEGETHMTTARKPMATRVPDFIDPPSPPWMGFADPGLLQKWISFHAEMDQLEAWLNVTYPDQDWTDAMQDQKDEADRAIRMLTNANKRPRSED